MKGGLNEEALANRNRKKEAHWPFLIRAVIRIRREFLPDYMGESLLRVENDENRLIIFCFSSLNDLDIEKKSDWQVSFVILDSENWFVRRCCLLNLLRIYILSILSAVFCIEEWKQTSLLSKQLVWLLNFCRKHKANYTHMHTRTYTPTYADNFPWFKKLFSILPNY